MGRDRLCALLSSASAQYSSTSGLSRGLVIGSTIVRFPMPRKPFLLTVVAIGLYGWGSLLIVLPLLVDIRDMEDPGRRESCGGKGEVGGVRGPLKEDIDFRNVGTFPF